MTQTSFKTLLLASLALIAFAGNSVLCRLALSQHGADPASFTSIRLLSGAVMLMTMLMLFKPRSLSGDLEPNDTEAAKGSWLAALYLFSYAALFSFAYVMLDTAVGALILFGAVQLTMVLVNLWRGNSMHRLEWLGFLLAVGGLVFLLLPELAKPSLLGFIMMLIAGIAWAGYTLKGQGSWNALADTAYNFSRTLPLALVLLIIFINSVQLTQTSVVLAIGSGAITSGLGYAIWYAALRGLSTTQAAVIQLLVPVIAAAGGVVFTDELITHQLIVSAALILGGIMLIIVTSKKSSKN